MYDTKARNSTFGGSHIKAITNTYSNWWKSTKLLFDSELLPANAVGFQWTSWRKEGREDKLMLNFTLADVKGFCFQQQKKKWYADFNKVPTKTFCHTKGWSIKRHVKSKGSQSPFFQTVKRHIGMCEFHRAFLKPQKQEARASPGFMHHFVPYGTPCSTYYRIYRFLSWKYTYLNHTPTHSCEF